MIEIFDYIGIIAFAISGALTGIRKNMDWFGVVVLGLTCALGGGLTRDLFLQRQIPLCFENWMYIVVAIIASIFTLIPSFNKHFQGVNKWLILMDTIGISVFSMVGAKEVIVYDNVFYTIFIGTVTATGGGILCDLFANQKPRIFVGEFYACSCIIGIIVMYVVYQFNTEVSMLVGSFSIIVIRYLAVKYNWKLPNA